MEIDHPNNIYDRNPETFRKAWMHFDCYQEALEQSKQETSNNPIYKSKFDELMTKFE
jgi:hypothetical protein